jgi:2-methylisocitrate lyase-like PEP mutase family enzyme
MKDLLARRAAVTVPGAANALFARVIEDLGFEARLRYRGRRGQYAARRSRHRVDDHDRGQRNPSRLSRMPCRSRSDTGYGNAVNMVRTVRTFERAGAAGIQIED